MKYALAFGVGLVVGLHLLRASESSCCKHLGEAARDRIAGYAGAGAPLVSTALDATGATGALPKLIDLFGLT